jgi:hypothetical protein
VTRENEIRGNVIRGNEIRGKVILGKRSSGKRDSGKRDSVKRVFEEMCFRGNFPLGNEIRRSRPQRNDGDSHFAD